MNGHECRRVADGNVKHRGTGLVAINPGASAYNVNYEALGSFSSDSSQQNIETLVPPGLGLNQDFPLYDVDFDNDFAGTGSNYMFGPLSNIDQSWSQPSPYYGPGIDSGVNRYGQQIPVNSVPPNANYVPQPLPNIMAPTIPLPVVTVHPENANPTIQPPAFDSPMEEKSPKDKLAIQKSPKSPIYRSSAKARPKHECPRCGKIIARRTDLQRHQESHCKYRKSAGAANKYHCLGCEHSTSRYDKLAEHCRKAGHEAPLNPRHSV